MKVEILIVTYAVDKPWLVHNLQSIRKFARGFSGTTIVCPADEASEFAGLVAGQNCTLRTYARTPDKARWHLHAQTQKCFADQHCPGADFILHTDSDCIFTGPVSPEDYFVDGKPVMVIKPWVKIPNSPWKPTVDAALKMNSLYSTMERHPQVNPASIYPVLRAHIERVHHRPFEEFVLSRKPTFPWGFTEHNVIGNFALLRAKNAYHWIDSGQVEPPREKLRQFWSVAPIDQQQPSPHGEPPAVPLEIINRVLA